MEPNPKFPGIAWSDLAAELRREHDARAALYPGLIAKGRMTEAEGARGRAVMLAMASDLPRMESRWEQPGTPPDHDFTWTERRNALLRELAYRARHYPLWISDGKLNQVDADRRVARLEALLQIYEGGFDWRPSNGLPPRQWNGAGAEARQARAEWHAAYFEACLRQGDRPMAEALLRELDRDDPLRAAELETQLHPASQEEMAV